MSKIGKQPIAVPDGVEVKINGSFVVVKGPKGELSKEFPKGIKIEMKEKEIIVSPAEQNKKISALWGLSRALLFNLIKGVTEGFEKKLEIEGVGYRANLQGDKLILSLGFSHPIEVAVPAGLKFLVEKNVITISGFDKELVGQTAAKIRAFKKPEPYKGKGIRYQGEVVRRKAGKKAVASA
jgi:large subunit ribosomal protein L6